MEGVSGIDAVKDATKIHELQTMCRKMCSWTRHGFPGCQPVSMDTKNIGLLFGMPYKVSWKADGTRYMMLIVRKGEVYLFDRDNTVFAASQFTFLRRKQPNEHIQNTLVDGELVIDKDGGHLTPRFLIYDIVVFEVISKFTPCISN
jgi:mRNA-capping enzyme